MAKYVLGRRAQTRSEAIKYTVLIGCLLVLVAVLQVSFFGRFRFFGAVPDVMLCTVLCLAFFYGRYTGSISGMAGGFLIEAIGGTGGVVLLPLIYFLYGYVVGYYCRAVILKRFSSYSFYLFTAVALRAAVTLLYACLTYKRIRLPYLFLQILLPEAVGTLLVGCVFYFPMRLFYHLLHQRRRKKRRVA
ncbi:MAG: hypothetical protein IJF33_04515 [Clostridia bacterium]|nr:hypothetical protein [Clostridia bacterium]